MASDQLRQVIIGLHAGAGLLCWNWITDEGSFLNQDLIRIQGCLQGSIIMDLLLALLVSLIGKETWNRVCVCVCVFVLVCVCVCVFAYVNLSVCACV